MVIIVVALSALTGISLYEHKQRSREHVEMAHTMSLELQQLVCVSKLNVFIQLQPKEPPLTLDSIPGEFWLCLPRSVLPKNKTDR